MSRPGFCKGCQSCITPCKRNDMKDIEEIVEDFLNDTGLSIGTLINILFKISARRIKEGL